MRQISRESTRLRVAKAVPYVTICERKPAWDFAKVFELIVSYVRLGMFPDPAGDHAADDLKHKATVTHNWEK